MICSHRQLLMLSKITRNHPACAATIVWVSVDFMDCYSLRTHSDTRHYAPAENIPILVWQPFRVSVPRYPSKDFDLAAGVPARSRVASKAFGERGRAVLRFTSKGGAQMKHEVMVLISALWIALSIPVGLAVGQFINAVMKGRRNYSPLSVNPKG